ncbi:hypothetical protein ACE1ET_08805 [Saccharicrinis sp. FJH62]|uniref:hypothetical protein n=1 Tax=Saccharicrinis sp. FJH62 TaxID=3344657 RepID=UPI0035D50383
MKKCSVLLLLFLLTTFATIAQETYLNTTLRKQSWSDLPVIYVNEAKGGLQTLKIDLDGLSATEVNDTLNSLVLPNFREEGMVVVVTDGTGNSRFFQYYQADTWREVFIITSWQAGVNYIPGQPILHNGNLFIAKDTVADVEPLVDANWKASWANLGGLDSTDLDFALKNLGNLEDVAINQDLTPNQTDTLDLGSALARWSNLYLSDTLFLGQDTAADIAVITDWTEGDTLNSTTLSSVGYTHKAIKEGGNEVAFLYGTKPVTRTGLPGVTGQSMDVNNLEDFLKKIFFPVTSPKILSYNYNGVVTAGNYSYQNEDAQGLLTDVVGTINVPFSNWSVNAFDFNYEIENRSVRPTDSSEDTPIDSVVIYNGSTRLAQNAHGVLDASITGSFNLDRTAFVVDTDNVSSNPLTLTVYDAYPNAVPLILNVAFQPALGVLINTAEVTAIGATARYTTSEGTGVVATPYLIERTGADINLDLYWTFNARDDAGQITDVEFQTNGGPAGATPANIAGTNVTTQRANLVIPNDHLTAFRYSVRARGAVANDYSPFNNTLYYQLMDASYAGFLPSDIMPTEAQVEALQDKRLNDAQYYETVDGITLSNGTGGSGFFAWAIPTYVDGAQPAPTTFAAPTPFYEAAGTWYINGNVNTYFVKLIPSGGGNGSWYWVCVYKASVANGGNIKVKLQ